MKEVSSAPSKVVNVRGMETTAANSESEQGDQLHQRAVRYNKHVITKINMIFNSTDMERLESLCIVEAH